ncbi:MAG: hypothetical protein ABID79_05220 [Elusimicrobiota bacterium]
MIADIMSIIFFFSSVYFSFPDGGTMLVKFGKENNNEIADVIKMDMLKGEKVYNVLSLLGWKPRIDWLILTPYDNKLDDKMYHVFNNFNIGEIYFTFDYRKFSKRFEILNEDIGKILLQISLNNYRVFNLKEKETIDLLQSISGVKFYKILPIEKLQGLKESQHICFIVEYNQIKILITSELTKEEQNYIITNFADKIKSQIFYHPANIEPEFFYAVNASWKIQYGEHRALLINGEKIFERRDAK